MQLNPSTSTAANAPLHALLDANLQQPPEFRDQLTNHLPMALHALHSLGASLPRMQAFYAHYSQRFEGRPVPMAAAVSTPEAIDWRALRGLADAYPMLLGYFNDLVARQGAHGSLQSALPALMPGIAAAAFHGAIRTAHAIQAGHNGELAAALAYWAWRWQPLEEAPTPPTMLRLETWASRLVNESIGWRSCGPRIAVRMDDASQSTVYSALASALTPAPNLATRIQEFAQWAVERYTSNPNFTVLHLVTAMRALRTLLPWLEDSEQTQALLARNVVAAYMAAQIKPLETPPVVPTQNWDGVIAAAIASDDDHVVKLVHACRDEAAVYGECNYLRAASLVTGL